MGLISAYTMIRALALGHLVAAALFLKNPKSLAGHNIVDLFDAAMDLVRSHPHPHPHPTFSF